MKRNLISNATKTLLVAFALILTSSALFAQNGQRLTEEERKEKFERHFAELTERLDLSEEQAEKVKPVMLEHAQNMKALKNKYKGKGRREMMKAKAEVDDIDEQTEKKLEKLLSKEQMEEYKKIREERKSRNRRNLMR